MKIDRVTFTGADESVAPEEILRVVDEYPDIKTEWALLLSKSNEGKSTRYPSLKWMQEFVYQCNSDKMYLAGHIQGTWLQMMIIGRSTFPTDRPTLWPYLTRIQLNFHGVKSETPHNLFFDELGWGLNGLKQYIFQIDGVNEHLYHEAVERMIKMNCDYSYILPLFDLSAGAGIVPDSWPKPLHNKINGYAGGLGSHNLKEELKRIEQVVGDGTIWIDSETNIRSNNDKLFDLDKCRKMLDIVVESNYLI